jgi:hypothetical protein
MSTFTAPMARRKFWLEPTIELAQTFGMNDRLVRAVLLPVQALEHEIRNAWQQHFGT